MHIECQIMGEDKVQTAYEAHLAFYSMCIVVRF